MKFMTLPIKNLVICSEDEDVEDVGSTDFDEAETLLEKIRSEQPNKVWEMVAVVDA